MEDLELEKEKLELMQSLGDVMRLTGIANVSGVVGDLSYYVRQGKLVVRRRRSKVTKAASEKQQAQRERIRRAVPLAREIWKREGCEWNEAMRIVMSSELRVQKPLTSERKFEEEQGADR